MISRAARRTSPERPSLISLLPSISAFSFSRVRSDAGILTIGVSFAEAGRQTGPLGFAFDPARVHPNPFPASLGHHHGSEDFEIENFIIIGRIRVFWRFETELAIKRLEAAANHGFHL
jgi:hypothetical protein